MDGSVRLDLGCGNKIQEGWLGVDCRSERGIHPAIIADITKPMPLPDDYADEMRAIHVIEHVYAWEALPILKEWLRILKPGGQLAIECPDMQKVIALAAVPEVPPSMTWWAIYGDPNHKSPEMIHKWGYTKMSLLKVMTEAGFVGIHPEPVRFHHPIRDLRLVGSKPRSDRVIVPA